MSMGRPDIAVRMADERQFQLASRTMPRREPRLGQIPQIAQHKSMCAVKVGNTAIGVWVVLIPKDGTAVVHRPRVDHARNPGAAARARGVVDGFGERVSSKQLRALRNLPCQAELKGVI